jgi:hypothetical protein
MTTTNETTALVLVPRDIPQAQQLAQEFSKSALLPDHFRGKPADVFLALALGMELGLPPVTTLQSVYVVRGRPGLYADAMVALILASGLAEYFHLVEMSADAATWEAKRRGAPAPSRVTVTMDMAKQAGWVEQNAKYKTEPDIMLSARAKSRLAKQLFPDVLRGISSVEEIRDEAAASIGFSAPPPPSTASIIDITEPASAHDIARRIGEAKTEAELQLLAPEIKALDNQAQREELTGLYKSHYRLLKPKGAPKGESEG